MEIIDLDDYHKNTYFKCLEDWSEEMDEAGNKKSRWYEIYKEKGLRVKLVIENEKAVGMIQYIPIEQSFVDGKNLYFIYCLWIHSYKQGVGDHRRKGLGKALLKAAEEDARTLGANGIAAWGIALPFWMKASWFKKQGYRVADKDGMARLMWKPFTEEAEKPLWIKQKKKPELVPGKVTVTSFIHGWCPAQNIVHERAKRASEELGEPVLFREINTSEKENFHEWGITDALYINKKRVNTGPPPSYEKIKKQILHFYSRRM
ncbi:MAG: GNAT family N-acetyltransferase [Spirochaetaceae bacterium]|nr:GNAT family N-acetyltransferase [Spirochaetaceae bacterium]